MHAIHDAGLDIPRDVSIIGFDDIPEAAHFWPPLTTVRQDFAELGRRCIALLLADIGGTGGDSVGNGGSGSEGYRGTIMPELIVRASTGRPSF